MGIYLNPGNKSFQTSIRSEIYVDKSGVIAHTNRCLNTNEKFICVSRARRFGKSMTLGMPPITAAAVIPLVYFRD